MQRINSTNRAANKFGAGKDGFQGGSPATGVKATYVTPEWANAVQEEIARAIEGAGIALDASKYDQLLLAIKSIAWGAGKTEAPWFSRSGGTLTGALYADGGSGAGTGVKGDTDQDTGWEWPSDGVLQSIVNGVKRIEFNAVSGVTSLWTHNGYKLVLQTDGNLVWYNASNVVLWSSNGTYSKTDADSRYAKLAGAVMQGVFCAQSGTGVNAGIKASGDNDTGLEWPVDGVMQELVNNVIRSKTISSDQSRRFYNGGFETIMQSDGDIVVRNQQGAVVYALSMFAPLASPALTGNPTAPTAAVGTNSKQIATTEFVQSAVGVKSLGEGQTWQNVKANRALNTVYTNTTGRAIVVSAFCSNTQAWGSGIFVDGLRVSAFTPVDNGSISTGVDAIIPAGSTYKVVATTTIHDWMELR